MGSLLEDVSVQGRNSMGRTTFKTDSTRIHPKMALEYMNKRLKSTRKGGEWNNKYGTNDTRWPKHPLMYDSVRIVKELPQPN